MSNKTKGPGDYEVLEISIKGEKLSGAKVPVITYRESIYSPSLEVNLVISDSNDSDNNLLTKLPVLSGDEVKLRFKSNQLEGTELTISVRIYEVTAGVRSNDTQQYVLKCISAEAYFNMESRIERLYKQKNPGSDMIPDILKRFLNSPKKLMSGEYKSVNLTLASMRYRPFDFIIKHICKKSIPTIVAKGEGKGSAGYLFWETSDGYNFKAMDEIFAAPKKSSSSPFKGADEKETYFWNTANSNTSNTDDVEARNVLSFKLLSSDNSETASIHGARCNLIGFFDVNSLQYNETIYKLEDNFKSFGHLAKGPVPFSGSGNPTRIMTQVYNNEMYENTDSKAQSETYDKIRQSLAQQLIRKNLSTNNKIEINIYGNTNLRAGDKIYLAVLKSKSSAKTKENYDKKQSGYYTIATLVHNMIPQGMKTSLLLLRDLNNEE
jgi:hypothetical protein